METLKKQKANSDKNGRTLDEQLNEAKGRLEEMETTIMEAEAKISKVTSDGNTTNKILGETEHKLGVANKEKKSLEAALEEVKKQSYLIQIVVGK